MAFKTDHLKVDGSIDIDGSIYQYNTSLSEIISGISNTYINIVDNSIRSTYIPDVSLSNDFIWEAGYLYVDVSVVAEGASKSYVDGSLAERDSSIDSIFNNVNDISIRLQSTDASINDINASLGNYATNVSVNDSFTAVNTSITDISALLSGDYPKSNTVNTLTAEQTQISVNKMLLGVNDNKEIYGALYNWHAVNKKTSNKNVYGGLYNWWAAAYSTGGASIAPAGWHVPTQAEITTLVNYAGGGGYFTSGGHLKETGYIHWYPPNTGAVNDLGFNGRGSGMREDYYYTVNDGMDDFLKESFTIWSSEDLGPEYPTSAISYVLAGYYHEQSGSESYSIKRCGFSIRLLKDNDVNTGTMTDYDGNVYPTVTIGTQVWLAENLRVEHYNDGTPITYVTASPAWEALTTEAMCYFKDMSNNTINLLPPSGWHVPTLSEYGTLISTLSSPAFDTGKLKEIGFTYWDSPNLGAGNISGFSARGTGSRDSSGSFQDLKHTFNMWTSTIYASDNNYHESIQLYYDSLSQNIQPAHSNKGLSVRLIKDDTIDNGSVTDYDGNIYPTVTIGTQVWMKENLKVEHYIDGTIIPNITDNTAWSIDTSGALCYYNNNIEIPLSGYATNVSVNETFAFTHNRIEYHSSKGGTRMYNNLIINDPYGLILTSPDGSLWKLTISNWGVLDISDYRTPFLYGALYNWWAASYDTSGASIAPAGWHVPTHAEIMTLIDYAGGYYVSGGHLKSTGYIHWNSPNAGATNEFGFNGKGTGYRSDYSWPGMDDKMNEDYTLWTSEDLGPEYPQSAVALRIAQDYHEQSVPYLYSSKRCGFPIRLLKDNSVNTGEMTDYDGNIYPMVTIGSQVWLAENLRVEHYNDGTPITYVADGSIWELLTTEAMCFYNNTPKYARVVD